MSWKEYKLQIYLNIMQHLKYMQKYIFAFNVEENFTSCYKRHNGYCFSYEHCWKQTKSILKHKFLLFPGTFLECLTEYKFPLRIWYKNIWVYPSLS